ncbi:transcriptional protein SWT1 isoform X1 [Echeneis naucrates]|uniref:Transcriptional protein SWT1 n=1 Tax=Echeneis naucrates TaxID=173247 RepID=A0A665VQI0_ECHNA|nr:transcriptional protein SWT1 isoform X1 [Echeneis naucrates]XP_029356100.1 transcriptional protein SWT1 isoform X1 [Echeneis naucrates]
MSKKSKRKRLSSSSSEEDEKASKEQGAYNRFKSVKRKHESCALKRENSVSFILNDSQSACKTKKPAHRQATAQAANQKPVEKAKEYRKSQSVSLLFHTRKRLGKAKNYVSEKDNNGSGSRILERGSSNPFGTDTSGTVPQKTESIYKGKLHDKSSKRSPAAEQKVQRSSAKKKHRAEESQRTGNDSIAIKDLSEQKRRELVKKMAQRCQKNEFKPKMRLRTEALTLSASISNKLLVNQHTTSDCSSKTLKKVISNQRSGKSLSHKTAQLSSPQQQIDSLPPTLPQNFKIPKKVQLRQVVSTGNDRAAISASTNRNHQTALPHFDASIRNMEQDNILQRHSYSDVTTSFFSEEQDKQSSLSHQLPPVSSATNEPCYDEIVQVAEQLHFARTEKKLEVNVMQSYGELTCMEIDPPEEGATDIDCKPIQGNLILVLDTNILLSHLDYVKKIRSCGLGALGFPVVLIPWVVLQELDSLKKGRGLSGSVAHLATPAISFIYNSLKSREPYLWGQSMQQAAKSSDGLNAENNDDRVLQCCLQYQGLYAGCALILCTNDKNLCSKALLSGVKALSKNDLEAEVDRSRYGFDRLLNIEATTMLYKNPQISSPVLNRSCTPAQSHSPKRTGLSEGVVLKYNQQLGKGEEKTHLDIGKCVSELKDILQEVLSDVLEVEMKAAYEDLWLEIVYLKPPWTLQDILQCLKKHWIAVFGQIAPRKKQQILLNLIEFFNSGKTKDRDDIMTALQEAKDLVKAFERSSSRVPSAISLIGNIMITLQQGDSPAYDIVMNDDDDDDDEDKQPTPAEVTHQEVWALFENIWCNVCQTSLEVFKVLGFDPHTMQSALPAGGPPPPQQALACLDNLSSTVSQLLETFSSVLSSAPSLGEVQALLSVIHSNKIVGVDSRLTAEDLLDCFSQQDYREKLRVGGTQLMELKAALDSCVGATGQSITCTMWPSAGQGTDICTATKQVP